MKILKMKRKYTRRAPVVPFMPPAPEPYVSEWDVLRAAAMKAEKDEFTFEGATYRTLSGRAVAPAPTRVLVSMPLAEAEEIAAGMADLLCWLRGYEAARGNDGQNGPMGRELTRTMRIALDSAIRQAREKGEK